MDERIEIKVSKAKIVGILTHAGRSCIITSHGMESFKDTPKYKMVARMFSEKGISVLRFDYRGCGESQGDPYDLEGRADDIDAVLKLAKERFDKVGILGSSLGSALAVLEAEKEKVDALILLCTPATVRIKEKTPLDVIHHVEAPTLFIHGDKDEMVPFEHSKMLYDRAQEPKELMIVEGGDHRYSNERILRIVLERSLEWGIRWFS